MNKENELEKAKKPINLETQNKTPKKKKKRKTFYAILGIIADIIMIPVIVVALFSSFVMLANQRKNDVKMVFGTAVVAIQSPSMVAGGFKVRDIVILRKTNTDNLRPKSADYEGDIIAFYYAYDRKDLSIKKYKITDFDNVREPSKETIEGRKTRNEIITENTFIYFHRIIDVKVDETGTRFFTTKGDSNSSADSFEIREDFVVGKYVYTPAWVRSVFSFCSSPMGMICLVIVPLVVLIFMQMLSLLELISALMLEKKVIAGQVPFNTEESLKANIGIELREFDKIYFYDITKTADKEEVVEFLWGYNPSQKLPVKKRSYLKEVEKSIYIYKKTGAEAYWRFWENYFKDDKKFKDVRFMHILSTKVKSGMSYQEAFITAKAEVKNQKFKKVKI